LELFEEEIEIYNSKMRLLNWIMEEISLQKGSYEEIIKKEGQNLPINI